MPMPQAGEKAPGFQLSDARGGTVSLSDFAGKNVVLYFYPKDNTPGCTVEACNFRDEHSALEAAGAVVLGVSPDSAASHQRFAAKFNLPFPLLVDEDHKLADAYGVWGEKSLYGRKFQGLIRSTFLIGPDGNVKYAWPKVKVAGHVGEVLAVLSGATPSAPSTVAEQAPAADAAPAPAKKGGSRKAPSSGTSSKRAAAPVKKAPARGKGPAKKAAPVKAAKKAAKKASTGSQKPKKAPARGTAKKGAARTRR